VRDLRPRRGRRQARGFARRPAREPPLAECTAGSARKPSRRGSVLLCGIWFHVLL